MKAEGGLAGGRDMMLSVTAAYRTVGTISTGLLVDVQAKESDAWTLMTQMYGPLVYHWCLRQGLQAADAEDVLQEVFRTVAVRVTGFRRERNRGSFRGWLRTITRNKLGDFLRSRRGLEVPAGANDCAQVDPLNPGDAENDATASAEETQILYARVVDLIRSEFEERTWWAFYRVVIDEVPPSDVAEEFGMTVNSIYLAKSRVLNRVRRMLCESGEHTQASLSETRIAWLSEPCRLPKYSATDCTAQESHATNSRSHDPLSHS